MIFALLLSLICLTAAAIIIELRLKAVRAGLVTNVDPAAVSDLWRPHWQATKTVSAQAGRSLSLHLLVFLREVILFFKFIIIRLEKKFARIIDLVHGKHQITPRESTSLFLNKIKDHRDQIRNTIGAD